MDRRGLLRAGALTIVSSAGCLVLAPGESSSDRKGNDDTPAASPEPTADGSDPTPDPDDPIQIVFIDDIGRTVTVQITRNDQTFLDVTESISSDYRAFDSGITSTGTYELSVSFEDGPDATTDLTIEEYDVRMGSNVIVKVRDGQIEFWIEE